MRTAVNDDLRISVSRIRDLPAVPVVLTRILNLVDDCNSTIQDLEHAILSDQSITAKVLRIANSAFYGFPRKITAISNAVVLIGFNTVKNVAIGVLVFEAFRGEGRKGVEEIIAGWVHALEVAYGAKMLATKFGYPKPEEAFVGGLLHDIGKLVLICSDYEGYRRVLQKVAIEEEFESHLNAERELLGITHMEIGHILAAYWHLPGPLIACIRLHHTPDPITRHLELAQMAFLANRLAHDESVPAERVALPRYYTALNLSSEDAERLRKDMKRYVHEMQTFFSGP